MLSEIGTCHQAAAPNTLRPNAYVMEATGVYWETVYDAVCEAGIETHVVNAQHVKQLKGRKSDVADSLWLARICQYGLACPSLVLPDALAIAGRGAYRISIILLDESSVGSWRMTNEANLWKVLQRVRSEASAARAFFHTWKALEIALGDTRLLATMNNYRYVDFFIVTMRGNFRLFFLSLGKIFEKSSRTLGLKCLANTLRSHGHVDLAEEIDKIVFEHSGTIKKIQQVRNESIAHSGLASMSEVFDRVGITANEIETLIDNLCGLLNTINERMGSSTGISKGKRNELAVQQLLETLHDNRFRKPTTDALSEIARDGRTPLQRITPNL